MTIPLYNSLSLRSLRFRHEDEGGRTALVSVTHLGILEDCNAKVVYGCQVGELHIGFRVGGQLAAELNRPYTIFPFPGGSDVSTVANERRFDNAGDVCTFRQGGWIDGDLLTVQNEAGGAGGVVNRRRSEGGTRFVLVDIVHISTTFLGVTVATSLGGIG